MMRSIRMTMALVCPATRPGGRGPGRRPGASGQSAEWPIRGARGDQRLVSTTTARSGMPADCRSGGPG